MIFKNRTEAAEKLSQNLQARHFDHPVVIALPRGGVPVAAVVAKNLKAPLDVLIVRKLGAPENPEYGIGALTEGDFYVANSEAIQALQITDEKLTEILRSEKQELDRRVQKFRKGKPLRSVRDQTVLLVDDGLATGVTAVAAVAWLKQQGAKEVIFCSPICSKEGAELVGQFADEVICLEKPDRFYGVGIWYSEFDQLSDQEVLSLLSEFSSQSERKVEVREQEVDIPIGSVTLKGILCLPKETHGIILFAHGSGSSRFSPRNQQVSNDLNAAGFATLLFDLLTAEESESRSNVFDIQLLADRLVGATRWVKRRKELKNLPLGFFGASTGGAAALWAAAELGSEVSAVVSRGGRPDLAIPELMRLSAPTLLIVGGHDYGVIELNREALKYIRFGKMELIEDATHLFEEPGALEQVSKLAVSWFAQHLIAPSNLITKHLTLTEEILQRAKPMKSIIDLNDLIQSVKDSKVVMLGEASHGTKEFYYWRRLISQELIEKHGFQFIAVEGDWPPCQKVNQFVRSSEGGTASHVLKSFNRWPTWMWANREVHDLIQWMHDRNQKLPEEKKTGFYGLDVYSLFESIEEVIQQVQRIDSDLAKRIQDYYACFDPFDRDERDYVRALMRFPEGCEEQVLKSLKELLETRLNKNDEKQEALFDAIQNARIIKNAERYYRSMIHADEDSWNIRDGHMMETLSLLLQHYGSGAKGIVWEHNTHIGDYRATDMVNQGQVNIGGLAREQFGSEAISLVGFGTYEGTVIASHSWAGPTQVLSVPPAKVGSYEAYFHSCVPSLGVENFYLLLDLKARQSELAQKIGHRAIGVVYDPDHERWGNYVPTSLASRYDAFIYLDHTEALTPIPVKSVPEEIPETFPEGV
jgi:putative phosphoribosyl transferase